MLNSVIDRIAIDIGKFPIKELQREGIKACLSKRFALSKNDDDDDEPSGRDDDDEPSGRDASRPFRFTVTQNGSSSRVANPSLRRVVVVFLLRQQ
jgi:hypothetical protein